MEQYLCHWTFLFALADSGVGLGFSNNGKFPGLTFSVAPVWLWARLLWGSSWP